MTRNSGTTLLTAATLFNLFFLVVGQGLAQDHPPAFRRIEIPRDLVEKSVRGLRPVSRADFEVLTKPKDGVEGSTFASARYKAFFDGEQLIDGTGTLTVDRSLDREKQFLNLAGNLAISNPRWVRADTFQAATVGRRDQSSVVLADVESNQLELEWSCRPLVSEFRRQALSRDKSRSFAISFPDAFVQELLIEAPGEYEVRASDALVELTATKLNGNGVWSIRWSGRSDLDFSVAPIAIRPDLDAAIASTYRIRASDVQVSVELVFTGFASSRVLELEVDAGLSVNSIRFDSRQLAFRKLAADPNVVLVELPSVSSDQKEILIEVNAIGKLALNELQKLPRVRPKCKWNSELVRCRIDPMLTMLDVQLEQCMCNSLSRSSGNRAEQYLFELETKSGEIRFVVGHGTAGFQSQSIVAIRMQENLVEAQAEVSFEPTAGELFELQIDFDTKEGWELLGDSIEAIVDADSLPRSVLAEQPKITDGRLTIQLDQAATIGRPVHVRLQLRNSLGKATSADQLMPLEVPGTLESQSWMYIENTSGLELATTGAEHGRWQRSDESEKLPPWIEEWIGRFADTSQSDDIFLKHSLAARLVEFRRTPVPTLPDVQSNTRLTFSANELRYSLDVQVDPKGKEMDSLIVKFSRPLDSDDWSFTDRSKTPVVTLGPTEEGVLSHEIKFDATSEPYQLHFEKILDVPIDESPVAGVSTMVEIPLASFDNTKDGTGFISIVVDGAIDLDIQPGAGLDAIPFSVLSKRVEEERKFRSAFRYDHTSATVPTLNVRHQKQAAAAAGSWVWRTDVRSFYAEQGRPRHRADYFIQSEGGEELRLQFSDDFVLETVEVDGIPLDPNPRMSKAENGLADLLIPLPKDNRFPCVSVKYVEVERSLRAIDRLLPPLLISDLPSMQETWQVCLPKDYRVYDPTQENLALGSWLSRITGYLGSPSAAEFQTSIYRSLRRKWIPSVDDPVGLIQQIEFKLGPDWSFARVVEKEAKMSWGQQLMVVASTVGQATGGVELLVDREELRRIGVFADTILPDAVSSHPRRVGVNRLRQSGLVLVVEGRRALVTSTAAARRHTNRTDWVDDVSVDGEIDRFGESRPVPIEEWATDKLETLWRPTRDNLEIGLQQAGWTPNKRNLASNKEPLKIYHRDTIVAASGGIFCLGFALGWWMFGRSRRHGFMACTFAMSATLLLPQPGATLACAFGWALVSSAILRLAMTARTQQKLRDPAVRRLTPTRAAIWFLVAIGLFVGPQDTVAQRVANDTQPSSSREEVFVYFPKDGDGEAASVVYLPSEFYRELKRRDVAAREQLDFLLSKADYKGSWPADESPLKMTANFQLTTFVSHAQFELPNFGSLAQIDMDSVRLNRQPVSPEKIGEKIYVHLPSVGDYRVSFEFAKPLTQQISGRRFDIPIPIAPVAFLELTVPRDATRIDVPTADGRIEVDQKSSMLSASLGPSSKLTIIAEMPPSKSDQLPRVEQNMRIQIGDKSTDVYVRFGFEDEPISLFLDVDPRLVLVNDSGWNWDPSTSLLSSSAALTDTLHFELPSTKGRFEIPEIKPRNAQIAKSKIAVFSAPQTSLRIDGGDAVLLPPESLMDYWGEAIKEPDLYFETLTGLPSVEVSDIPLTEKWSSELSYFFDQLTTHVEVKAQLMPEYEETRQTTIRRLRIPAVLEIQELSATSADGVNKKIRWRRFGEEVVLFFLDRLEASASSPLEINIKGSLTTGSQDSVALPVVELISNQSETAVMRNVVNIYRAADVSVNMEEPGPFVRDAVDSESKPRDGYRLFGTWSSETVGFQPAPDALTVTRRVLKRKIRGSVITRLIHDNSWWADIIADLECEDGIDVVYLDVPSSLCFKQPRAFEDEDELRVDTVRGGPKIDRRMIAVWLPEIPGKRQRTIRLETSLTQDRTTLPRVRLVNVELAQEGDSPQQFVELPLRSSDASADAGFTWKRTGLTPIAATAESASRFSRYRVSQPNFKAQLEEQQSGMQPEITLLNTMLSWRDTGDYVAMSEYDLTPAQQARLLISTPQDSQILQVFCNGNHTAFSRVKSRESNGAVYKFQLSTTPWPQKVRVIYRGPCPQMTQRGAVFEAPNLLYVDGGGETKAILIGEELWSIDSPAAYGEAVARSNQDLLMYASDIDSARVKSFVNLWTRAQRSIRERPRSEKAASITDWTSYLAAPIGRLAARVQEDVGWQNLQELINAHTDELAIMPHSQVMAAIQVWHESQWTDGNLTRFRSALPVGDELPSVGVTYPNGPAGSWPRYLIALGLIVVGVVFPRWDFGRSLAEQVSGFPHAICASIGGLWWLLLAPSWVGALIVASVLAIWVWNRFQVFRLSVRR